MESKYFSIGKPFMNGSPFNGSQKLQKAPKKEVNLNVSLVHKNKPLELQRRKLPVFHARNKLLQLINKHETIIIIGETGCGKTTQIPQFIFEENINKKKKIGVTQPRRVAATTLANRVAQEMAVNVGDTVGYCIRFEDVTTSQTKLQFLTDGMLLMEAVADNLLTTYNVIVLDEAHERTIHTDVLFGIVKEAQRQRSVKSLAPLKIIIMSATMDVDHFSHYFNNCPVVYLEGREYKVDVHQASKSQDDYIHSCLVTVFQIHQEASANEDILVFLTGEEEIESMSMRIKSIAKSLPEHLPPLRVLTLYSSLPSKQLELAFHPTPPGMRKVVLSTNIAETSVTIPGIKFVVDSGRVKIRQHNPTTGLDMLKVQMISQAQACQRTGRAGRERDGACYRVFTNTEFNNMSKTVVPEIQRCNLADTCLRLLNLNVDLLRFDFMDKPPQESLVSALQELELLGAVDSAEEPSLTTLGRLMAKFPVDPRYSKVILSAKDFGCVEEALCIVAVLSGESVLVQPLHKRDQAKEAQRKFLSSAGDHISLLNIFRNFRKVPDKKGWCCENFLNHRNLMYAVNVRKQLLDICTRHGIPVTSCGQDLDTVRKCLLTGLFMNVAELQRDKQYVMLSTRQTVSIHPSSFLAGTLPACVLFSEVVETNKRCIRQLSLLDKDWLHEIAPEYFSQHRTSSSQSS